MATAVSQEAICSLVQVGTLELKAEAASEHNYNGVVVIEDILLVIDYYASNLQVYRRLDGKLLSTSHRLEDIPMGVCLISKTEVAVCLRNSKIVILSFKSTDDVILVKTFNVETGFYVCFSVAKWNRDKLIVSGVKLDAMLYWCVVNLTDGRVHSTHKVCRMDIGYGSHMPIQNDTLYILCWTYASTVNGVYAYDIYNPHKPKFVHRHDGFIPDSIMVDERNFIYVWDSNRIHQLTDSGQLVTTHTLSSIPYKIFYDDQHGVLYTTRWNSNVITVYRLEYSHQPDSVIPAEVLKMDVRSLQMFKEALNEGKEKVYNIRVMVVGQYGVGKTTLTQRLLGENVNISERHSTDGIDVHVECCKVSLPAGEWTSQEKNVENYFRLQRLVKLLNEHVQKLGSEDEQNKQVEMVDIVTSEEQDNRHPHHDHLVSAEQDNSQEVKPPSPQPEQLPTARVVPESSNEIVSKENEKDTVMEILKLVKENSGKLEKSMVEYAALALWDFAGQYVFYTTHQTFLTCRAIYLLVIDLSQQVTDLIEDDECFLDTEGIKPCKVYEMIEIWLNSIHSCEPSSHRGIPYVILVGTHLDKISENIRQKVIDEYFTNLRKMLSDKPIVLHLMDDFAIDNTHEDPRLELLKQRIFELSKQQPHWGEEKPARWLPLEQAIMTLKASGVKVAPLSLIEEINRSGSVRIEDRDKLDLFLRYQHEMGTILYFSIEGLREKIVLDPQWLIDAQKSLITAETFIRRNPAIIGKWYEFKQRGKLTHELIDAIWLKEKNPEFHDNKDHIILLMEKLNIIARPRTYDQDGLEVKVEHFFLVPCMLKETTPREIIFPKPQPEKKNSSVLCYVFIEQFLPTPIFHRLLAACIAHWPIAKRKNSEFLIFCGCCVFQLDLHHKLTMFFREHVIYVRVTRTGTTGETPSTKLCIEVKNFINITLSSIIGNLEQSLRFELYIQCPKSEECSVNSLISVADLEGNVDVPCHFHDDIHVIVSCELLSFWFQKEGIQGKEESLQQQQDMERRETSVSKRDRHEEENTDIQDQFLPQVKRAKTMNIPSKTCQTKGVPCSDPKLLCQILNRSQQGASSSQSILEVNCLSVGLEPHYETPANGNCFFEAISSQLRRLNCGMQKSPQQLRQEVVAFMRTNRALHAPEGTIDLASFIYGETFEDYCTRMTRDGEWADHVVVVAMARKLQIDIMIVTSTPSAGPEDIIVWIVGHIAFHGNPILLGHIWESHYVSLQPIAHANLVPFLVGSSAQATTYIPMPARKSGPTPDTALGPMSSPAVDLSATRASITQHVSSYSHKPSTTDAMETSLLGSTPSSTGEFMQTETYGSTQSTSPGSTTAEVIHAAASNFTTTPVMQSLTDSTFNVMPAATSASTPSTTDGLMQVQTYVSAPFQTYSSTTAAPSLTISSVMKTPKSGSTTANFMQVMTFASTPSSTIVYTPSATFSSITAAGMQTVTSSSTTDAMQTPAKGLKPSTSADLMLAPVSISTASDLFQVQTFGSEPPKITGPMPVSTSSSPDTSSSPTAVVIEAPTTISLPSTTAGLMQASASSSTSTDVTQPPAVEDTDRFMHIACLLVNVGSRVLRRLLLYHTVMPGCTLDQYLATNRMDIDNLRKRKILNKSQMDILFPPGGSTNLGDYDITLLSALFTNIVLTIRQQELNMIQFLRDKRNEIFAHAKSVAVNSSDYQTFWNDICRTLEALSKQCNDPDFVNEILSEIQGIQVSTVQGTSFLDTLQACPRRIETLERLVQALISSQTQESNKASDNNDL